MAGKEGNIHQPHFHHAEDGGVGNSQQSEGGIRSLRDEIRYTLASIPNDVLQINEYAQYLLEIIPEKGLSVNKTKANKIIAETYKEDLSEIALFHERLYQAKLLPYVRETVGRKIFVKMNERGLVALAVAWNVGEQLSISHSRTLPTQMRRQLPRHLGNEVFEKLYAPEPNKPPIIIGKKPTILKEITSKGQTIFDSMNKEVVETYIKGARDSWSLAGIPPQLEELARRFDVDPDHPHTSTQRGLETILRYMQAYEANSVQDVINTIKRLQESS